MITIGGKNKKTLVERCHYLDRHLISWGNQNLKCVVLGQASRYSLHFSIYSPKRFETDDEERRKEEKFL